MKKDIEDCILAGLNNSAGTQSFNGFEWWGSHTHKMPSGIQTDTAIRYVTGKQVNFYFTYDNLEDSINFNKQMTPSYNQVKLDNLVDKIVTHIKQGRHCYLMNHNGNVCVA